MPCSRSCRWRRRLTSTRPADLEHRTAHFVEQSHQHMAHLTGWECAVSPKAPRRQLTPPRPAWSGADRNAHEAIHRKGESPIPLENKIPRARHQPRRQQSCIVDDELVHEARESVHIGVRMAVQCEHGHRFAARDVERASRRQCGSTRGRSGHAGASSSDVAFVDSAVFGLAHACSLRITNDDGFLARRALAVNRSGRLCIQCSAAGRLICSGANRLQLASLAHTWPAATPI